jgi:hypothetical protein
MLQRPRTRVSSGSRSRARACALSRARGAKRFHDASPASAGRSRRVPGVVFPARDRPTEPLTLRSPTSFDLSPLSRTTCRGADRPASAARRVNAAQLVEAQLLAASLASRRAFHRPGALRRHSQELRLFGPSPIPRLRRHGPARNVASPSTQPKLRFPGFPGRARPPSTRPLSRPSLLEPRRLLTMSATRTTTHGHAHEGFEPRRHGSPFGASSCGESMGR